MLMLLRATIFEWLVLLWSTFSVPFYILVLSVIIRHRKQEPFNSPFFKLCISEAVADIAVVFIAYPLLSFRVWGWLDWGPLFYHQNFAWLFRMGYYSITWLFAFPQITGVFILCINRFESIMYTHKPSWDDKKVIKCVVIQWLSGVLAACPFPLIDNYTVERVNGTDGYQILYSRPPKTFHAIFLVFIFTYIFTVVGIVGVLYFKMFRKVRSHNQNMNQHQPQMAARKSEWRLALMGFALLIVLAMYGLFFALYAATTKSGHKTAQHVTNILLYNTGPILSLINPYLMVICSKKTRSKFLEMICYFKNKVAPKSATQGKQNG